MPDGLSPVERSEWDRMVVRLEESQSLWTVDDGGLYQYCRLFAETEAVAGQQAESVAWLAVLQARQAEVAASDLVVFCAQMLDLRKTITKCTDQLRAGRMAIRQYLVEFGLTPASRGRVKLPPVAEKDEFTAFQQARPRGLSRVK